MSVRRHLGFGSTPNFSNLWNHIEKQTLWERYKTSEYFLEDGDKDHIAHSYALLAKQPLQLPTLTFRGSEKLHGENMAVAYSQGEVWVQGRKHIRTLLGDQNGMAAFVDKTKDNWLTLFTQLSDLYSINTDIHTIVIDAEWSGDGIQKDNAACSGTDKGAYIFDYFRVVNNNTDESKFYSTTSLEVNPENLIYLMSSFGSYSAILDFNKPTECEEILKTLAESIEDNSPIAKYYNKLDNVGEGAYLWCNYNGEMLRLKTKGLKHGGKPKEKRVQKPLDSELEIKLQNLADKVTPEWRLTQAITETNATEMKHIGEVMKWVNQDIIKEEMPLLHEAGVEPKQLGRFIASIVKKYYIDSIKNY